MMLERLILSPRGFKIYLIFFLPILGILLLLRLLDSLPLAIIDYLQYQYIWGDKYVPLLSLVILAIPVSFVCFCIGFAHDLLTSQGVFSDRDDRDFTDTYPDSEMSYHETIRQEYINHARSKYRPSIHALKSLGFEEMKFYNEVLPWFGFTQGSNGINSAVGALLSPAIIAIGKKLSIKFFSLAMVSQKDFTYACVTQMGVSFYTKFTDGTFLISSNYWGSEIKDDNAKVYKTSRLRPVETAWAEHQQQVKQFIEAGKHVAERFDFDNYLALDKNLNDYVLKRMTELPPAFPETEPSFMATMAASFAGVGAFMYGVLGLLFLLNAASNFYPACVVIKNMRILALPVHFVLILAVLGGSWLLARSQNVLWIVNGSGTMLFGRATIPNGQGYVSTKWLIFFGIPLLPVRSYWVVNEYLNPRTKRQNFQMQPTPTIYWAQVKATIQTWLWRYAIVVLLVAGIVSLIMWQCAK